LGQYLNEKSERKGIGISESPVSASLRLRALQHGSNRVIVLWMTCKAKVFEKWSNLRGSCNEKRNTKL